MYTVLFKYFANFNSTDSGITKYTGLHKAGCINEISQASCIQVECKTLMHFPYWLGLWNIWVINGGVQQQIATYLSSLFCVSFNHFKHHELNHSGTQNQGKHF